MTEPSITDTELEACRANLAELEPGLTVAVADVGTLRRLVAEVDRLRVELTEMTADRDKYQNWYDAACDEVREAYQARNEED